MSIKNNTTSLQSLLEQVNALPEEIVLPELTDPANAEELFANKELINADGNKITGTFTIDTELSTQDSLIAQIQTALQNKTSISEPVLQTKTATPTTNTQDITPDSGYDGLSKVTISGDTDLIAENIKSGVDIFGVSGTYAGNTDIEDGMIMGTISGNYTNDRVTTIRNSTFAACSDLTSVNFPIVTSIGTNAFAWCSNLTSISFPEATTIGSSAFTWCSHLTSVNFPIVTSIGNSAFSNCSRLTTINFPIITTVPSYAF